MNAKDIVNYDGGSITNLAGITATNLTNNVGATIGNSHLITVNDTMANAGSYINYEGSQLNATNITKPHR